MPDKITRKTAHHNIPTSVLAVLKKDNALTEVWNSLTDIQRNEWSCYVMTGAKAETREKHVKRLVGDMKSGKKSPCCWPGCPHRRESAKKFF